MSLEAEQRRIYERITERADALLSAGTLVFTPGERVAYAFVVSVASRDDLADALGDLTALENERA